MQGLFGGTSAAAAHHRGDEPELDWVWAYNMALSRADENVTVLIGTHGQIPIKQDGSFMPRTVTWDAARYPGTVCGVQSTIFGQANFMDDVDAKRVARIIKQTISKLDLLNDNAMVDFAGRLKAADTDIPKMAQQGVSFLDDPDDQLDLELQTLPTLSASLPLEQFRYPAFRYSPTGDNDMATNCVSLIDKEFLINRGEETRSACKTSDEWHINIYYKDNRNKIKKLNIFPLLIQWAAPLTEKRSGMSKVSEYNVTSMQNIVKALHVAGFRNICIVDLTCFVFRPPVDTRDDWILVGDHFSRVLTNMVDRYYFKLIKRGKVRLTPQHMEFTREQLQNFKKKYQQIILALRRRAIEAVQGQGARCAIPPKRKTAKAYTRKKISDSLVAAARESSSDSFGSSANSSPEKEKGKTIRRRRRRIVPVAASAASAARESSSDSSISSSSSNEDEMRGMPGRPDAGGRRRPHRNDRGIRVPPGYVLRSSAGDGRGEVLDFQPEADAFRHMRARHQRGDQIWGMPRRTLKKLKHRRTKMSRRRNY
jgi:hypothetical protein